MENGEMPSSSSTSRSKSIPTTKKTTSETMLRRLVPVNWPTTLKSSDQVMPANLELMSKKPKNSALRALGVIEPKRARLFDCWLTCCHLSLDRLPSFVSICGFSR